MDGIHIHIAISYDGCGYDSWKDYTDDWFSFFWIELIIQVNKMVYVWPTWLDTYVYSNNLIVMRYRWRIVFFYWIYSLKDCLRVNIKILLEWEFPFEDRLYYHFLFVLSYSIVRKISWLMQYNKVGEIMYKIMIVEDDELISKKLESFLKSWTIVLKELQIFIMWWMHFIPLIQT